MRLITDATFNEGGLLERVADNPEGVVDHYLSFDKNKDEVLQSSEYNSIGLNTVKALVNSILMEISLLIMVNYLM